MNGRQTLVILAPIGFLKLSEQTWLVALSKITAYVRLA